MAAGLRLIPIIHPANGGQTMTDSARDHLIVALDVPSLPEAEAIVRDLRDEVLYYKVGPHLFVDGLVKFIEKLIHSCGKKVFLDFKSFDIGDTIRGMAAQAARLEVDFMTIGRTASTIIAAKQAREERSKPKILVVTLLTDHDEQDMRDEFNTTDTVEQFVTRRALEAKQAGADGVICSPREVRAVRDAIPGRDFLIVTPGVRPNGIASDDQRRVATPAEAIAAGANYLVVGRPIIKAENRLQAAQNILYEMQEVLAPSPKRAVG
jgi:orotidine-5'-phosphate decarboxylase